MSLPSSISDISLIQTLVASSLTLLLCFLPSSVCCSFHQHPLSFIFNPASLDKIKNLVLMCPPLLSTSHPRHTSFLVMKVYQRFRATQKLSRCVIHHFSYNSRRWREIFVLCLPSILSYISFFSNQHLPSSSHPLLFVPFLALDIITNYDSVVILGKSWMFCILRKLDVIFNRTQSCVS